MVCGVVWLMVSGISVKLLSSCCRKGRWIFSECFLVWVWLLKMICGKEVSWVIVVVLSWMLLSGVMKVLVFGMVRLFIVIWCVGLSSMMCWIVECYGVRVV